MTINNVSLEIKDGLITCKDDVGPFDYREWSIELLPDKMVYRFKKKIVEFLIDDISEIQYEANGFGRYEAQDAATAFIIVKGNTEPQLFFTLIVAQRQFALMKDTEASKLCQQILEFIHAKYNITWTYKISIETKAKKNALGWVIVILIFIPIWIWLINKYHL